MKTKEIIERLSRQWTFNALGKNRYRNNIFKKSEKWTQSEGMSASVSFRIPLDKADKRINISSNRHLFQWRTSKDSIGKPDRFVFVTYGDKSGTKRIVLEEYFFDPTDILEEEIEMFEALFPEISRYILAMGEALDEAEIKIQERVENVIIR